MSDIPIRAILPIISVLYANFQYATQLSAESSYLSQIIYIHRLAYTLFSLLADDTNAVFADIYSFITSW